MQEEHSKMSFFITLNHISVFDKKKPPTNCFRQHFDIESLEMETKHHDLCSQCNSVEGPRKR